MTARYESHIYIIIVHHQGLPHKLVLARSGFGYSLRDNDKHVECKSACEVRAHWQDIQGHTLDEDGEADQGRQGPQPTRQESPGNT